jgi:5'-3' exonuclease
MKIHVVDGTYELFRCHFGAPPATAPDGREVGGTRGILRALLSFTQQPGVTHVAVAFDHVIESFRNDLFPGYKTSDGVPPELLAQFPLAEEAAAALGFVVWPMVEFEADDALATAAHRWKDAPGVEQVVICTPDKDLAQCVSGDRVVCWDRKRNVTDEAGVRARFGIGPGSIPDYLALVGDDADGIPGLASWGPKSAATVLARWHKLERIPDNPAAWDVAVRGAETLGQRLRAERKQAELYRTLATLRTDAPLPEELDDLRWRGASRDRLAALAASLGEDDIVGRVSLWR